MANELEVIIKEGNLEGTKAKYILDNFTGYFLIAAEWEKKASMLSVTNASQLVEMKMAREGRLFLRDKRVDVEKARKRLKEEALREGQTIDAVAKVLTSLIKPIEDFLDQQEHFVERQQEAKEAAMRLEIEARIEAERIAKEKADMEEQARVRAENNKLKQEASRAQAQALAKRAEADKILAKEREKARIQQETAEKARKAQEKAIQAERAKAEAEKKLIEEKARLEREKQEKTLINERAKAKRLKELAEEKALVAQKAEMEKAVAERKEKERLTELLKAQITCPACGHKWNPKNGRK